MEGSSGSGRERSTSSRGLNVVPNERLGLSQGNQPSGSNNSLNGGTAQFIHNQTGSYGVCGNETRLEPLGCAVGRGDISLRQWLDKPERVVDHLECLHIFQQIVETVSLAHSQGVVVQNVRPSCFVMSSFNRISFIESTSRSSSGSDSSSEELNGQVVGGSLLLTHHGLHHERSRLDGADSVREISPTDASVRGSDTSCLQSSSAFPACPSSVEEGERRKKDCHEKIAAELKKFPQKHILLMEMRWYTSPEEFDGTPSSFSSDVYQLGVLLFELFCTFSSMEEKLSTMANMRHRVLSPQLLLKWPKEASFCLGLLHPQPSARPKISELLQSEFLNEPRNSLEEREAAIKLREETEEQELLLEFLLNVQQKKQEASDKLQDTIDFLSSDIDEVTKKLYLIKDKGASFPEFNKANTSPLEKLRVPIT